MNQELLSYVLSCIQPQFLNQKAPCPLEKPRFINEVETWKQVFQLANHLVVSLPLSVNLSRTTWHHELPKEIQLLIDERVQREKMILAILDHELDSVLFLLIGAKIPVLLLKGMDWGRRYYPERILRPVSELDIIVPKSAYENAHRTLGQGGYRFLNARFTRIEGGPTLRLHSSLTPHESDTQTHQIWQRALEQISPDLPSHTLSLSHEDNLIYLIKLCTKQNLLSSPIWLNDLHYLFQNQDFKENADWDWLVWYFARHQLTASAWFVLNFLNSYSGVKLPKETLDLLGSNLGPMKKHLLTRLATPEIWFATETRTLPWTVRSNVLIQDNVLDALKFSFNRRSFLQNEI